MGPGVGAEALNLQHVERCHNETLRLSRVSDSAPFVKLLALRPGYSLSC